MLTFYMLVKKIKQYIPLALVVLFIVSCDNNKDNLETAAELAPRATVTTTSATVLSSYSVIVVGDVVSDGGNQVTERGVCYATNNPFPDLLNQSATEGAGTGTFSVTVTGLSRDSLYYIRAYARTVAGTGYGNVETIVPNYVIGQSYQGGILFYLDNTKQHGLIAATSDQGSSVQWGCAGDSITGATALAYGKGLQNTDSIVAVCITQGIAASVCKSFTSGGYSDWYAIVFRIKFIICTKKYNWRFY